MATLEFMVPTAESEAFNTAVYRFLELKLGVIGDDILLESAPFGPVHRKRITLWSDAALLDFTEFWSGSRKALKGSRPFSAPC
jgi:hypothetical protein